MPLPPLKLSAPKKPLGPPKAKKPISAFADASDDDNDDSAAPNAFTKPAATKKAKSKAAADRARANAQLSTFTSIASTAASTAAAAADPSVYDYDAAWDSMQSVTRAKRTADAADAAERKPKYMENLLVAAEVRKRDALRAKEKLLAKEREEEGEEFKDKEAFVTEAYKAQQEALLKAEKEELEREEALRKKSAGMSSFHRNMLEKMEGKHDAVVAAAEAPVAAGGVVAEGAEGEDVEGEVEKKARELREKGAAIEVNEEGQVVDKTQLLSGGLNVAPAKSKARIAVEVDPRRARAPGAYGRGRASEDSRARQTRMVEQQLEAVKKREREAEEEAKEEIVRQSKSRKTETDVMSAKERYLQRKAAAAAAAKEKEGGKGEEGK